MNALHIAQGRIIDPAHDIDRVADLFVADGRIVALGKKPTGFEPARVLDAQGCIVCPGLVDLAARLREPGNEYRATLESEMAAAAAGGVTSLACPPDTDPPLDEPGLVEMLKQRTRLPGFAHVYPVGALTLGLRGERLTEMAELAEAGCLAFGQADCPIRDTRVLFLAMQYAASFGLPVWLNPADPYLAAGGVAHDGAVAAALGLAGIPVLAETIALTTYLQLAKATGVRLHIARISSAASLDMIVAARAAGIAVTCDVDVHHIHLTEADIAYFDANAHVLPPLRGTEDCAALRAGLASGAINALCSNHCPVDDDAKQMPFAESEAGATALELLLPLAMRWGQAMHLPERVWLARITCDPARLLGIPAGTLQIGAAADLCIFDPQAKTVVTPERLHSQGRNTPFLGQRLSGAVRYTVVGGEIAYEAPTYGRGNQHVDA